MTYKIKQPKTNFVRKSRKNQTNAKLKAIGILVPKLYEFHINNIQLKPPKSR